MFLPKFLQRSVGAGFEDIQTPLSHPEKLASPATFRDS
jgi:hypothetical protein